MDIRDRIQKVLRDHNDASIYSLAKTANERTNMQRQINGDVTISLTTIHRVHEAFPEVSIDWLLFGEGLEERTKIVTPPQHRQDIHLDAGATAAISQSGTATIDTPKEQPKEPDIATMIRNNDLGGLVAIIMQQKDEIIRLKEQRIHDLEVSVRIADNQIFPPVK